MPPFQPPAQAQDHYRLHTSFQHLTKAALYCQLTVDHTENDQPEVGGPDAKDMSGVASRFVNKAARSLVLPGGGGFGRATGHVAAADA